MHISVAPVFLRSALILQHSLIWHSGSFPAWFCAVLCRTHYQSQPSSMILLLYFPMSHRLFLVLQYPATTLILLCPSNQLSVFFLYPILVAFPQTHLLTKVDPTVNRKCCTSCIMSNSVYCSHKPRNINVGIESCLTKGEALCTTKRKIAYNINLNSNHATYPHWSQIDTICQSDCMLKDTSGEA